MNKHACPDIEMLLLLIRLDRFSVVIGLLQDSLHHITNYCHDRKYMCSSTLQKEALTLRYCVCPHQSQMVHRVYLYFG